MPIWRRKRVQLLPTPQTLLHLAEKGRPQDVFFLEKTGEIFSDYESYIARLSFYRTKQFQCEVTGKGGLDYFQAIESERQEGKTLHARFPESLKAAVLRSVQWQIMGRLDNLVEAVYDRFKDRYFTGEKVLLDVQGEKFWACVLEVFPPRHIIMAEEEPHRIGSNLNLAVQEAIEKDDPSRYYYKVQIQEEGSTAVSEASTSYQVAVPHNSPEKWGGSVMDVQCSIMSRDRLAFSKSLLRRFLRDTVDRDAAVASPWTVKPNVASKYGIETQMSEDTKKGVEDTRKGQMEKRKKLFSEKEGPPSKKLKQNEDKTGEDDRVADDQPANTIPPEVKKKKPIKYPTEDLDVLPSARELKQGLMARPCPKRDVPFGKAFEQFLMSWNYLQVFGLPLHLSPFTLDSFEEALKHSSELTCFMVAEIHTCLIYNIRQLSGQRNLAISSLYELQQELNWKGLPDTESVSIQELVDVLQERGNNWERAPLRSTPNREWWEDAVIGVLKDHATVRTFPRLRNVLTAMLFSTSGSDQTNGQDVDNLLPTYLYNKMPPSDKIALLSFLCDCSISTKAVRNYMDACEEQLTQLRKERTELNRERKRCLESMDELSGKKEQGKETTPTKNEGIDDSASGGIPSDEDVERRSTVEDVGSENGSRSGRVSASKNVVQKKVRGHAYQRQMDREKVAKEKAALAEYRKLDEEVNKLDRRLEVIEIEFRKLLGVVRAKPLGRDRFFTRIWWLDGLGGAALSSQGGAFVTGCGRLFIQGPSDIDWESMEHREAEEGDVMVRMRENLGDDGVMDIGEWGYYSDSETLDAFISWLNHKGKRELQLKNALTQWKRHIIDGMNKRKQELTQIVLKPENRRSSRNADRESGPETYLSWTNRRAPNGPINNGL